MPGNNEMSGWKKRTTLSITGFLGMALMYSLRFNLSIAIVAMVDHDRTHDHNSPDHFNAAGQGNAQNSNNTRAAEEEGICPALLNVNSSVLGVTGNSSNSSNSKFGQLSQGANDKFPKFKWSEKEQGIILGSFFWGYMITQFPGGVLAQRFGAKWVVSLGILLTGILALILPSAAIHWGITGVVIVRVLQGLTSGVIFPAFTALVGKWTGPKERAGIATLCYSGMPFGTAATMVISGHLISLMGWPAVFYVPGILTILWFIAWSCLVYSSPNDHPSISLEEFNAIQTAKETSTEMEHKMGLTDIPWKSILSSVPFWAIFVSHFTSIWGLNTLKSEGPKYLNSVLHFDIHQNAYFAAIPEVCQGILCIVLTRVSDYLIYKKWISLSFARKFCNTVGQWGTACAYLGLILSDCDRTWAVSFFMLTGALTSAIFGGMLINPIDISPNYAGALEGLINGVSNLAGFGAPYVAGLILNSQPNIFGWKLVFLIPVIANLLGNLCFLAFSSTKVQSWNDKETKSRGHINNDYVNDDEDW